MCHGNVDLGWAGHIFKSLLPANKSAPITFLVWSGEGNAELSHFKLGVGRIVGQNPDAKGFRFLLLSVSYGKNATLKNFFSELRRRNVYKVAVAYAVVAWLMIQAASIILPAFEAPPWILKVVIFVLIIGFPVALVFAWAFELTPEGLKRTEDVDLTESVTRRTSRKLDFLIIGVLLLVIGVLIFQRLHPSARSITSSILNKSIAVLPFENRSRDPDNAFFADGVQDQILTDLARIADLKVISRTSVMHYKSSIARNLRQIGEELGVAHVLEGSVQRSGNRVRVNAQLVDARTDRHLWAQTYDRDLADVFAIQSEIAKAIAEQLQAKLSPSEKIAIERAPTNDVTAFDLHTHAKDLILTAPMSSTGNANLLQAVELLNQAVARDPSFFQAYCSLAEAHDQLYQVGFDHTSARLALAEAAIEAAARLRPNAGETHLARAGNLYQGYLNYDGALGELELARQTLPNDSRVFELTGYIQRRQQGRYEEATRTLERALELDPRNLQALTQIAAFNYRKLGRYADAKLAWDRLLAITPDDVTAKAERAMVDLQWKGDTRPLHEVIESIQIKNPAEVQTIADRWIICALAERDARAAKDALIAAGRNPIGLASDNVQFRRAFVEGVIARMMKDEAAARTAFTAARAEQEKIVQAAPNHGPALCVLGLIDAGLDRKEQALREGRRAIELLPVERDAVHGLDMIKYFAVNAAWIGDKDLACDQLTMLVYQNSGSKAIRRPRSLSYGELKLMPLWDPLRGDPRFEKIVASLAPKEETKR
jgi:TolB-like protein/Tfp pilus assembly protein PilF